MPRPTLADLLDHATTAVVTQGWQCGAWQFPIRPNQHCRALTPKKGHEA